MTTLVLKSNSENDIKALTYLAKKLGMIVASLSEEEIEDIGMSNAIKEGRKKGYVNRSVIMKTLKKK